MILLSDEEQKKVFANNLKRFIKETEQKKICCDLDIKTSTLNQWVNAKAIPRVSEIRKLANYFNVGICELVDPPSIDTSKIHLSSEEATIVLSYRQVSEEKKECIRDLLHIQREKREIS